MWGYFFVKEYVIVRFFSFLVLIGYYCVFIIFIQVYMIKIEFGCWIWLLSKISLFLDVREGGIIFRRLF